MARPARSAQAIDRDFEDLIASRLPGTIARDKFERLWDETNAVAAEMVLTAQGQPYISLLKRMHQTFESRYPGGTPTNGFDDQRS